MTLSLSILEKVPSLPDISRSISVTQSFHYYQISMSSVTLVWSRCSQSRILSPFSSYMHLGIHMAVTTASCFHFSSRLLYILSCLFWSQSCPREWGLVLMLGSQFNTLHHLPFPVRTCLYRLPKCQFAMYVFLQFFFPVSVLFIWLSGFFNMYSFSMFNLMDM